MKERKAFVSLLALALFFLFLGLNPVNSEAKEKYEEKFAKTVSLAKNGKVELKNISGDIDVKTWDSAEVKIDALKISRAGIIEQAKENAKRVEIVVEEEGKILRISTKYPKTIGRQSVNVSVDYHLTIPAGAEIEAESVSGDIAFENIGGKAEAETVSGDINVMKADKGVKCKSVSGDLELKDIIHYAYLKSVSGDIALKGISGSVEAKTVSGDIKLEDVSKAKVVESETVSGEIIYQGEINPDGRYKLKSHSGDVKMTLPSDSAFDLEAKTFSGSIECGFEIIFSGKIERMELKGRVNAGGADLMLKTFSGDIVLKKR